MNDLGDEDMEKFEQMRVLDMEEQRGINKANKAEFEKKLKLEEERLAKLKKR